MENRIIKLIELLESSPKDLFLNHALALEYIKIGEEQKAKSYFETNLNTDENYVATYYHYAKLLERLQLKSEALEMYEKGMQIAQKIADRHSYNELQAAFEDLSDE